MIRTSYDRGQRCALFMEQEVFQFFVDCAHATHQSKRSTNTWIVPPQESPIFSKFSSSEMPNSSICGFPSLMTSMAASTTAGSTHPPLTEPVNSPLSLPACGAQSHTSLQRWQWQRAHRAHAIARHRARYHA